MFFLAVPAHFRVFFFAAPGTLPSQDALKVHVQLIGVTSDAMHAAL
jgi:hypothetical protein